MSSPVDLVVISHASQEVARIEKFALHLGEYVRKHNLYQNFGTLDKPRNHLYISAWQFTAHFFGVTAKVVSVEDWLDQQTGCQGWKSTAQAIHVQSGTVISEAQALCTNEEENWDSRPKYEKVNGMRKQVGTVRVPRHQVMSMSQTRAMSKVLSNVFRFVAVLAGFEGTPAEEMTGNEHKQEAAADPKPQTNGKISEEARKKLFAAGRGVPMEELGKIWAAHGFKIAAEITTDKYSEILAAVEAKARAK